MSRRGKIMRDPTTGPGLVIVQGEQHQFGLEGVWKSDVLPRPGLVVDVEFDAGGRIAAMSAVPEAQIAREQAEAAMAMAKEKGAAMASGLVARVGIPRLAAAALLVVGWFFLSTVSIDAAFLGKLKITFWQVLGFLNADTPLQMLAGGRSGPSAGFYGVLAIVCLAGPFAAQFWKDRRAHLGGLLPLLFMIVVGLMVRSTLQNLTGGGEAAGGFGGELGGMYADMQRQARAEAMKAVSIGFGAWLSLLASLYFAAMGLKDFLVRQGSDSVQLQGGQS